MLSMSLASEGMISAMKVRIQQIHNTNITQMPKYLHNIFTVFVFLTFCSILWYFVIFLQLLVLNFYFQHGFLFKKTTTCPAWPNSGVMERSPGSGSPVTPMRSFRTGRSYLAEMCSARVLPRVFFSSLGRCLVFVCFGIIGDKCTL